MAGVRMMHQSPSAWRLGRGDPEEVADSHVLSAGGPQALELAGLVMAFAGGLGTWVVARKVPQGARAPVTASVVMGYSRPAGVGLAVLAVVGVVAVALAALRRTAREVPLFLPELSAAMVAALAIGQLVRIHAMAVSLAAQALDQPDFDVFHAGFGWGGWCLLVAAVLLLLGVIAGILRQIDARRAAAE